jgi:putative ABC transport system ATP-binding protein
MLSITQLKAGYNNTPVVDIPDVSLAAGEHCLILGKSGAGKTTLLYALAGLLTPLQGNIRILGTDITTLGGSAADNFRGRHTGIIYQTLHMVGALNVLQNLLLVPYAAGLPQKEDKALHLLTLLGLADIAHKYPRELSQGQQQRVAIARAAMNSPAVILGDEPTSALDDEACDTVMQLLLTTAKDSNASLIIATHDQRIRKYFTKAIEL